MNWWDNQTTPNPAETATLRAFDATSKQWQQVAALLQPAVEANPVARMVAANATRSATELSDPVRIIRQVAEIKNVTEREILSSTRRPGVVAARHLAMFLVRDILNLSYNAIGELFDRDHTTVIWGFDRIERELGYDMELRNVVALFDHMRPLVVS